MIDATTLLALLTGHLLGDFLLQTDEWAARKMLQRRWLAAHAAAVAAVTWLLLGSLSAWLVAAVVLVAHLAIDLLKPRRSHGLGWFAADQALHVLALVGIWWAIGALAPELHARNLWTGLWGTGYAGGLALVAGFVATVWTLGVILKYQMADFAAGLPPELVQGLPRAGRTVGQLERLLVFVFVLLGRPDAIAFVVAAKSVFRIGDLTAQHERNHAEYIMIGTLRSFAYALLLALATRWLLDRLAA